MAELKFTYSQLSTDSILQLCTQHYPVLNLQSCKYYVPGLHDNYFLGSNTENCILRVYRNDWRSDEEIYFELELLTYLKHKQVSVAFPLLTENNKPFFKIASPEGTRIAALFKYADGFAPAKRINVAESMLLGETVATLHLQSQHFKPAYRKQKLDITYLLDDSISAIIPYLQPDAVHYIHNLRNHIVHSLPALPEVEPFYCICAGDINPSNFHINRNKQITLFDFDQCGFGFRSFEIAKFISSIQSLDNKKEISQSFIEGYEKISRLNHDEVLALPFFVKIALIWVMAIHVYNANRIGHKWLEQPFWERHVDVLKSLE